MNRAYKIIAFTARGEALGRRLADLLDAELTRCSGGGLDRWTAANFKTGNTLVFIGSLGICVRAIAPYAREKISDPAVLCLDEDAEYIIPVLSGHYGGANQIALDLARVLGSRAVITTATDRRGVFAVDSWAQREGLRIVNPEAIVRVSSALLDQKTIKFFSTLPIEGKPPVGVAYEFVGANLYKSETLRKIAADSIVLDSRLFAPTAPSNQNGVKSRVMDGQGTEPQIPLQLIAPIFSIGIGCRRGTATDLIKQAVFSVLSDLAIPLTAINNIGSIDLKADEAGLLLFSREFGWPLVTASATELASLPGNFSPSEFVLEVTGVDNVCERAALMAAGSEAILVQPKKALNGVTVAVAKANKKYRF